MPRLKHIPPRAELNLTGSPLRVVHRHIRCAVPDHNIQNAHGAIHARPSTLCLVRVGTGQRELHMVFAGRQAHDALGCAVGRIGLGAVQ